MKCGDCVEWIPGLSDDTVGTCQHEDSHFHQRTLTADHPACPLGYTYEDLLDTPASRGRTTKNQP